MQIRSLKDIIAIIDELSFYLQDKTFELDEEGFPVFKPEMFLDEWPDLIVPYSQRKNWRVTNPSKTVICFFDRDQSLYPRLGKVINELDEYRAFMGVIGLDITITEDMDEEWQMAIYLLNQLFLAVLAANDIKIVANTRTAGIETNRAFKGLPYRIMAASGFLGCETIRSESDLSYISKILTVLPEKLIIYGKHDRRAEEQLDNMGIDYRVYTDFHRLCKEVRHG